MKRDVVSTTVDLDQYGGAQKVMMDIHQRLKVDYSAKVLGFCNFGDLHPKYGISKQEYVKFYNPFYLNNKVLLVHSRNVMAVIMLIKWCFFLNTKILYVAHNVYDNLKWASLFPRSIISISTKVTNNLISYFKISPERIQIIYNGIKDEAVNGYEASIPNQDKIIILYSARINTVKRQLEIVNQLTGKLDEEVEIHFAGTGPDYDQLVEKCNNTKNFKVLGFVKDVGEAIRGSDYLMLFSVQEGLPISLIEGIMFGKPLLVNDVGGNLEIGIPDVNAILLTDWDTLADKLNNLKRLPIESYQKMSLNSRAIYNKMFTYDQMVEKYSLLIKTMI